MTAIALFLALAALMMWAVFGALRTPKPRQYPWLTNKKARSRRA